jgi:hypothetical protein
MFKTIRFAMAITITIATVLTGCSKQAANSETETESSAEAPKEEPLIQKPEKDADGLEVKLDMPSASPPTETSIKVRMTVRNPTETTRTFCDYHTPFEGIRNDIFEVRDSEGNEIGYAGMMAKRAPPDPTNFIHLKPGASRAAEVDLNTGYTLPVGKYTVRYKKSGISGLGDSNTFSFEVTE